MEDTALLIAGLMGICLLLFSPDSIRPRAGGLLYLGFSCVFAQVAVCSFSFFYVFRCLDDGSEEC